MRSTAVVLMIASLALALCGTGCHPGDICNAVPDDSKFGAPCRLLHDSPCVTASLDHIQVLLPDMSRPPTPSDPESLELWQLTLKDALTIALENSEVVRTLAGGVAGAVQGSGPTAVASAAGGFASTAGATTTTTTTGTGTGAPGGASPGLTALSSVAQGQAAFGGPVTIYDPAISETQVQAALAAFDTTLETSMFWEQDDRPPGTSFLGVFRQPGMRDTATFRSALTKPLATGGQARIAFNTDYLLVPLPRAPGVADDKAQYTSNVEFSLRQPLLRGAGVEFNRAPIVIARLQSDQSVWDFKQAVLALTRSVEEGYWNLHSAYVTLRSVEEVIPLAAEVVRIEESRLEFQKAIPADVAQARTQFEEFRQQRVQAMANLLAAEAALRQVLGLPPADGRRIVPKDDPLDVPVRVDWAATVTAALENRPEIVRERLAVRVRELQLLIARNGLRPQLDAEGLWRVNGLGQALDDAIDVITDDKFTDWQLGVTLRIPLGFRREAADVQRAQLELDKENAILRERVHETAHTLNNIVQNIDALYEQYQAARARRQASREWAQGARIRFENPPPAAEGQDALLNALNIYLQALRSSTAGATDVASLLSRYNTELARLEEAKGTLLAANNIRLDEDPCAIVRQHQRLLPHLPLGELPEPPPPATQSDRPAGPEVGWSNAPALDAALIAPSRTAP